MKKRRHHYVWREYLRAWAVDEKIFCLRKNNIINPNLMGIGQQRDFYKLKELDKNDIEFIRTIAINTAPDHLIKGHEKLLNNFTVIFKLKDRLSHVPTHLHDDMVRLYETTIHNLDEDLHSEIEGSAIKYIQLLLDEDTSFFRTDRGFLDFIYYICVQYMRTKKMRESIILSFKEKTPNVPMEKCWNILSHMFATNMGWNIYKDRNNYKMVLIKNTSSKEFITGDQPVVNIFTSNILKDAQPDRLAFYYPISPNLAILIIENKYFRGENHLNYSEEEVDNHNQVIFNKSHEQIYSKRATSLEAFKEIKNAN
ncbi:MAG: DUF4238 domain-containing protein [Desulfobulbia bacterium]